MSISPRMKIHLDKAEHGWAVKTPSKGVKRLVFTPRYLRGCALKGRKVTDHLYGHIFGSWLDAPKPHTAKRAILEAVTKEALNDEDIFIQLLIMYMEEQDRLSKIGQQALEELRALVLPRDERGRLIPLKKRKEN